MSTSVAQAASASVPSSTLIIDQAKVHGIVRRVSTVSAYQSAHTHWFNIAKSSLKIVHPTYVITQGTYQVTIPKGGTISAIELAANPVAHTNLIEIGSPQRLPIPQRSSSRGHFVQSTTKGGTTTATNGQTDPSTSGWFQTGWNNWAGCTQSWVQDNISFSYDGTYVTSYSGSDKRWWNSGWSEVAHAIGSYYNSTSTAATVWTYDKISSSNGYYMLYNDNNVVGHGNGSLSGYVNTSSNATGFGYYDYTLHSW